MFANLSTLPLIKVVRKSTHQHQLRDQHNFNLFFAFSGSVVDRLEQRLFETDSDSVRLLVVIHQVDFITVDEEEVFVQRSIVEH